jgi:ribosomal protein S12 methylthiotransferase accessory factor YcaO
VDEEAIEAWKKGIVPIDRMGFSRAPAGGPMETGAGPARSAVKALQRRLEETGVLEGWETRTESTLSPFAVERPWRLEIRTRHGRHAWRLQGTQTSYGRGLAIQQARMSCLMEIVERISAFASFEPERVPGIGGGLRMLQGPARELEAAGRRVLDLERVRLEVPYQGDSLCWVEGEEAAPDGPFRVLVPAQLVFLFANLDEASLTSGLSSNGLGAGKTTAQARLSGLLEVIERDSERVVPFSPEQCFVLEAEDPRVSEMLSDLERKGLFILFRDLTAELGVPCYQAFVEGPGGVILKGCGANLDARRAVVSAMTEIPWPYPYWFGTAPPPEGAARVRLEDLPDWSTGDAAGDLGRLEALLAANGYTPVYVDLTREDMGLPVCRALVPGLEMMTLFDRFTPLGVRPFGHYLALFS